MGISPTGTILNLPPPRDYSKIVELTEDLPPDVKGTNIDRLLSFISLVPVDESFHHHRDAYLRMSKPKEAVQIEQLIAKLMSKLSSICEQSKRALYDLSELEKKGLEEHLNRSLADFFLDRPSMLVDAASLRQGLLQFAESGRRSRHRSPKPNIARGIVRAVCVYRHEQGLKGPRFDWGPYNAKGKRGLGRYATRPIPQTPVARLIAAVVDGLELNIPNSTLKTELSRYGRLVNQAGRDPEYVDLLCGGEGQSPDTQLR